MPLPIIAVALAWLIEAGLALLSYWIRAILLQYAAEVVWPVIKAKIAEWARDVFPRLIIEIVRQVVGLDVRYPLSPASLTAAVNERIGQPIFTDVTDEKQVRDDLCKFALRELNAVLPGVRVRPEDFNNSTTARKRLARKLRVALENYAIGSLEAGESALMPADVVKRIMAAAQSGYDWAPHVNKPDIKNEIGRQRAAWYRRHATRTRTLQRA